jgi:hypothetical protein
VCVQDAVGAKLADKPSLAEAMRQLLRRALLPNQTVLTEAWRLAEAGQAGATAFLMDVVAWFPAAVVAAIGTEAQAALGHAQPAIASAALALLAAAAPSFGKQLGGDRCVRTRPARVPGVLGLTTAMRGRAGKRRSG